VWVDGETGERALRAALAQQAPHLRIERTQPGLHDVVLRELALAQGEAAHAGA
jgi:hypothetical protein